MASQGWLSTLLTYGTDRAFPNLYDVKFTLPTSNSIFNGLNPFGGNIQGDGGIVPTIAQMNANLATMQYRVESIEIDGINVETDYSEAQKLFMMKSVTRVKKVSLSIWETSKLETIGTFKDWMNAYYSFENNCFLPGDPSCDIEIKMDNQDDLFSTNFQIGFDLKGCIPVSLSHPSLQWSEKNPYSVKVTFTVDDSLLMPTVTGQVLG